MMVRELSDAMKQRLADGVASVSGLQPKGYGFMMDLAFSDDGSKMKLMLIDPEASDGDFDFDGAKLRKMSAYAVKRSYATRYFVVAEAVFEGVGESAGKFCTLKCKHKSVVEDDEQ